MISSQLCCVKFASFSNAKLFAFCSYFCFDNYVSKDVFSVNITPIICPSASPLIDWCSKDWQIYTDSNGKLVLVALKTTGIFVNYAESYCRLLTCNTTITLKIRNVMCIFNTKKYCNIKPELDYWHFSLIFNFDVIIS